MKNHHIVAALCIGFLFITCKKENPSPIENSSNPDTSSNESDCLPVVWPDSTLQIMFGWTSDRKRMPHFNPANNNQFSYTAAVPGSNFYNLCVHDLSTGITEVILEGQTYLHQPKWHENGWILFRGNANIVYRIKGNGDSLTVVSDLAVFHTPTWRPDGKAWISNNVAEYDGNTD